MSIGYPKMLSGRQKKKSMALKETEKNKDVMEAKGSDCPRQEGWSTYQEMLKD